MLNLWRDQGSGEIRRRIAVGTIGCNSVFENATCQTSRPSRGVKATSPLDLPKHVEQFRLDARQQLLAKIDQLQRRTETRTTQMYDAAYERAFRLLTSPKAKEAFDLTKE